MAISKITIIGFNEYMTAHGRSLWDLMEMPEGIDKETLIDNILLQGGEFEVVYSDPEFMRKAISVWSKKHLDTFNKWLNALSKEFNPIENYDRYAEWTDTGTAESTDNSNTVMHDDATGHNAITNENKVSAYDSNDYTNHDIQVNTGDNTNVGNSTANVVGSHSGNDERTHTEHIHGNIGVTTSSALLKEYLDVAKWNIYNQITDLFMCEFCIMVY